MQVRMEEHARARMLIVCEQTTQTNNLDRGGRQTDVSIAAADSPELSPVPQELVWPVNIMCRPLSITLFTKRMLSRCTFFSFFLFVSCCHGAGVCMYGGNRIGTHQQQWRVKRGKFKDTWTKALWSKCAWVVGSVIANMIGVFFFSFFFECSLKCQIGYLLSFFLSAFIRASFMVSLPIKHKIIWYSG